MSTRGLLAVGVTTVVTATYLLAFGPARSHPAAPLALTTRLSEADALARTRPIVANLWPARQDVQMVPDLAISQGGMCSPMQPNDTITAAWQVVCEDLRGHPIGTITLNAANGELLSIVAGPEAAARADMSFPEMKPLEARKIMRQWIKSLLVTGSGDTWREVRERKRTGTYISDWRKAGRMVHLTVNARTGSLAICRIGNAKQPDGRISLPGAAPSGL